MIYFFLLIENTRPINAKKNPPKAPIIKPIKNSAMAYFYQKNAPMLTESRASRSRAARHNRNRIQ
jgi:hypothetical protein